MTYTEPLLLVFLGLAFTGLIRQRRRKSSRLLILGLLGLFVISWPPLEWLFSRPLEARYGPQLSPPPADAIVVFGAGVEPPDAYNPYARPDALTYERCEFAAWLYRNWRQVPILASGGIAAAGAPPFSHVMREVLLGAGVPADMLWTEERSRSTHENALYSAEILRGHGIGRVVLVVEAQSMMRAAAAFRKEGIEVVPAPSSRRDFGPLSEELLPSWKAIRRNELTLHETLGMAWYWMRGWI
jgi:uncharacterized SAM-binding protein YcdF (DUF218 family)